MLLNGILFNSEAWHWVTKHNIRELEKIDKDLLRRIFKAHSKTPLEFLYLESGVISIKWILAQRRVNYLKTVMEKDTKELVRKVLDAQKLIPTNGDFIKLVEQDIKDLGTTYDEIISKNKLELKAKIETNARSSCFKKLNSKLATHKKVKHIEYKILEMQPYLRSANLYPQEVQTLTALCSNCVRTIGTNFTKMLKNRIHCPLLCKIHKLTHMIICSHAQVLTLKIL